MSIVGKPFAEQCRAIEWLLQSAGREPGAGFAARAELHLPDGGTPESFSSLWGLLCAHADRIILDNWAKEQPR
jgi:hypothetical protein